MDTHQEYDRLEKVFNVGTGLSNLNDKALENLTELLAEIDSLFDMFSSRYTIDDLRSGDPFESSSMNSLINQLLDEQGIMYPHDDIRHGFLLCFSYTMTASYYVWGTGVSQGEVRDQQNLVTFVYETPHSKTVFETYLLKLLEALGITDNAYLYIYYLTNYVYKKFTRTYQTTIN